MGRTTSYVSLPGFMADPASVDRNTGVQIDWASVDVARKNSAGKKVIEAGTILAEKAGGKVIPRADVSGAEVATGILETTAVEDERSAALSGYGCLIGGALFKNLLPENAETDFADWIAELNDTGVGTGFAWLTYADNRES
jgi:hypothetical protein